MIKNLNKVNLNKKFKNKIYKIFLLSVQNKNKHVLRKKVRSCRCGKYRFIDFILIFLQSLTFL